MNLSEVAVLHPNQDTDFVMSRQAANNNASLKHGGNDGGNSMLEVRVAKLESDVEYIKKSIDDVKLDVREIKRDARTDFRIIFGSLIAVALGLAGIMAKGFHWL
ncbi:MULTISPECIES: hypothetical protein [Yersinia]|uniref:hypothetical protein n=1 Tax=Yersinia TaxID=629 RepID=UPI0021BDC172|nr:hypothetical protein [Yersinia bercovieri]